MVYIVFNVVLCVINAIVAYHGGSVFCWWVSGFTGGVAAGLLSNELQKK